MQNHKKNNSPGSLLIGGILILCICFLVTMEAFIPEKKPVKMPVSEPVDIVVAEAVPTATVSPIPTLTPTPTPVPIVPTPEPKPLSETVMPSDPYPELYGDNPGQIFLPPEEKTVYLTFDDGPSAVTESLLDALYQEQVPATFFVMGDTPQKREILKRILAEGHTIGVHTYTHDYHYLYWNKDAFLADFCRQYYAVWDATGYRPRIFRFPGGSVNSYNTHLYRELIAEMEGRGFVYYDWNVTSEDAAGVEHPEEQLQELLGQSQNKSRIIALLHDTKKNPHIATTVTEYIRFMKEAGYQFKRLDSSVEPKHFPYFK
ncbi:MAG: polysaccharide deacetylase [Clostridia bacterium]|nr:polysaccharide deacetylase [Clostridia bacterium]